MISINNKEKFFKNVELCDSAFIGQAMAWTDIR